MSAEQHQQALLDAFAKVLKAESAIARVEAREKRVKHLATLRKAQHNTDLVDAWADIAKLMADSGEYEVTLPGAVSDYKIATSAGTEVVDCPDIEAVPPEYVKVEKSLKKKELLADLKGLREAGKPLPNWASIKRTPGQLGWKPVKKA